MASCKVQWILYGIVLASCVLISSVASDETESSLDKVPQTIEELTLMLRRERLSSVKVDKLLDAYPNKQDKIGKRTVGELNNLCNLSVDKCSHDQFKFISSQTTSYYVEIPSLYAYGEYCRYQKLANYCLDNIDVVFENLQKNVTKEEEELVSGFRKTLSEAGVIDSAHELYNHVYELQKQAADAGEKAVEDKKDYIEKHYPNPFDRISIYRDIRKEAYDKVYNKDASKIKSQKAQLNKSLKQAYLDEVCIRFGSKASVEEQELFLSKFQHAAKKYADIYSLLSDITGDDESGSKLKGGVMTDTFKFSRIVRCLYQDVLSQYYYGLVKQIVKKSGSDAEIALSKFRFLTEDQVKEIQTRRKPTLGYSMLGHMFGGQNRVCRPGLQ